MPGQINRGSTLGEIIYAMATDKSYKKFLEIGTWNGQGSTACFIDGFEERDDDYLFISLETDPNFYPQARSYHEYVLDKTDKIKLVFGRIVDTDDQNIIRNSTNPRHPGFLRSDLNNYNQCENVWDSIKENSYDVVLLDGGEFTTYAEFLKLEPITKIFILDDSNMLKNQKVVESLNNSNDWAIRAQSNERHGFAIYEKVNDQ